MLTKGVSGNKVKVVCFAKAIHWVEHVEAFNQLFSLRVGKANQVKTGDVVVFFADILIFGLGEVRIRAKDLKCGLAWISLKIRPIKSVNQK